MLASEEGQGLIHSVVCNNSGADSNDPDQTKQMCRLILAFAICIYPKTTVIFSNALIE